MIDKSKPTLILGAYGRIGKSLIPLMEQAGYNLLFPTKLACNLLDRHSYEIYFHTNKPHAVINLAARNTNIHLCNEYPASICRDTLQMNMNVLEACKQYEVEKLLNIVCSCSYPHNKELLVEDEFYDGATHASVSAHGLAKRMVYYLDTAYAKQFHLNIVTVALNNVFGGASWAHPSSLKFIDSLIVRVVDAKLNKMKAIYPWGSGGVYREAILARDAADGILRVFEQYDNSELINIGTGIDYTIKDWLQMIIDEVKYRGLVEWQTDKLDGQRKKLFSVNKQRKELSWMPPTNTREALSETIKDYKKYLKEKNT